MTEQSRGKWLGVLEFLVTVAAASAISWLVARCHTTSIWMDMEFTGWVAPIANRLNDGVRLYSEHRHSPMPPLPVLLTYAISGGHATWLTESVSIVVCQSILVAVMYVGLARYLPRPIPLVASLLSIPVYFALFKTISYDAITQALVAVSAVACVAVAAAAPKASTPEGSHPGLFRLLIGPAGCALLAALTVLSKQSTGVGLALGMALVLGVVGPHPWRARLVRTAAFLGLCPVMYLGLCLAMMPWVDLPGMIRDTLLIGSEPKGGARQIGLNLRSYVWEISAEAVPFLIYGIGFAGLLHRIRRRAEPEPEPGSEPAPSPFGGKFALAASMAAIATPFALLGYGWRDGVRSSRITYYLPGPAHTMLWAGLFALLLSSFGGRPLSSPPGRRRPIEGLVALLMVLFPSAIFHSMSTPNFRWTYDNNPLITVALAGLVYALLAVLSVEGGGRRPGVLRTSAALAGVVVISGVIWGLLPWRLSYCQACIEEWPEVAFLKGARLRKSADGLRELVAKVRALAPDPAKDAVLLLPNDPNVEAWFERRRPELSSSILFTDQYWKRYVDRDFEALVKDPPKVIIVGPRGFWVNFQNYWNGRESSGRLIGLVLNKLIPGRYTAGAPQLIQFQGQPDFMDVYVRDDDKARPVEEAAEIK